MKSRTYASCIPHCEEYTVYASSLGFREVNNSTFRVFLGGLGTTTHESIDPLTLRRFYQDLRNIKERTVGKLVIVIFDHPEKKEKECLHQDLIDFSTIFNYFFERVKYFF